MSHIIDACGYKSCRAIPRLHGEHRFLHWLANRHTLEIARISVRKAKSQFWDTLRSSLMLSPVGEHATKAGNKKYIRGIQYTAIASPNNKLFFFDSLATRGFYRSHISAHYGHNGNVLKPSAGSKALVRVLSRMVYPHWLLPKLGQ